MLTKEMEQYAAEHVEELKQFIRDLAPIPAPSRHEDKRVAWVKAWMEAQGAEGVIVDEMKNVIWPYHVTEDNDLLVVMAHTDVVFPDTDTLPFREDENYFYCPGVGDDTARLATLMISAKYFIQQKKTPKMGILFIANSCEEGLGNSLGAQTILKNYMPRIKYFVSNDGGLDSIVNHAVGSHRYHITATTIGGHSWGAFGNPNAIYELSDLLHDLYAFPIPEKENAKTTRNVGTISGGTSVNTIAQKAECLFEYRSDDIECLKYMEEHFKEIVGKHQAAGKAEFTVDLVGNRPCGLAGERAEQKELERLVEEAHMETTGRELHYHSASTDANFPLSFGIPAVTIGSCTSFGTHTREEYLQLDSLEPGLRYFMNFLSKFFED